MSIVENKKMISTIMLFIVGNMYAATLTDYGAIGDGKTDNTTAIQKAFDSGAKDIYVPTGNYLMNSVQLPDKVRLHGCGAASVLLLAKASRTKYLLAVGNDCTIENLAITGGEKKVKQTPGEEPCLIHICEKRNVTVRDVRFYDYGYTGIGSWRSRDLNLSDNHLRNMNEAIRLRHCNRAKVLNNTVIDMKYHGIEFWGQIWRNGPTFKKTNTTDLQLNGNIVIRGGGGSIWGAAGRRITMNANIVDTAHDVGLDLEWCFDNTIFANTVRNCETGGVALFYSSKNVSITGNTIVVPDGKRGRRDGIWLTPTNRAQFPKDFGHENVSISGNTITSVGKPKHGIAIGSGSNMVSAGNVLSNCDIHDATGNLIVLDDRATRTSQSAPEDMFTVVLLSQEWHLNIDSGNIGIKEKWYRPNYKDDK